eukprot:2651248-Rhodomonas_salina.1
MCACDVMHFLGDELGRWQGGRFWAPPFDTPRVATTPSVHSQAVRGLRVCVQTERSDVEPVVDCYEIHDRDVVALVFPADEQQGRSKHFLPRSCPRQEMGCTPGDVQCCTDHGKHAREQCQFDREGNEYQWHPASRMH